MPKMTLDYVSGAAAHPLRPHSGLSIASFAAALVALGLLIGAYAVVEAGRPSRTRTLFCVAGLAGGVLCAAAAVVLSTLSGSDRKQDHVLAIPGFCLGILLLGLGIFFLYCVVLDLQWQWVR